MDIDQIVLQEQAYLAAQENSTLNDLSRIYQDSLIEIRDRLAAMPDDTMTRRHLQAMEAQLDVILSETYNQQRDRLAEDVRQAYEQSLYRERNTWISLETFFQQPTVAAQFSSFLPIVPQQAVKALIMVSGTSISHFSSAAAADMRTSLARSLVLGEGTREAARRLEREGFNTNRGHLQLIARMELSRAQNEAKADLIGQMNDKHPELDLWQLVRDRIDKTPKTRNHWFSWAVNNTVRNVTKNEFFEVDVKTVHAAQQAWHSVTHRKVSTAGVVWEHYKGGFRGQSVPAHYNDRAVLLPWRPAWGVAMFGGSGVKHPQGPITSSAGDHTDLMTGNYDHEKLKEAKDPNKRHYVSSLKRTHGPDNSVILDVGKDTVLQEVESIRQGQARQIHSNPPRYQVESGRIYGQHDNSNFYPVSGEGIVTLSKQEYSSLEDIQKALRKGNTPAERRLHYNDAMRGLDFKLEAHRRGSTKGMTEAEHERVLAIIEKHFHVNIKIGD